MLRAHGYQRTSRSATSSTTAFAGGRQRALYSTDAPRRAGGAGGLGRSLLFAASLGAISGMGLMAWDIIDPASAAPVKSSVYHALDSVMSAVQQAREAAEPYVQSIVGGVMQEKKREPTLEVTQGSSADERSSPQPVLHAESTHEDAKEQKGAETRANDASDEARIFLGVDVVDAVVAKENDDAAAAGTSVAGMAEEQSREESAADEAAAEARRLEEEEKALEAEERQLASVAKARAEAKRLYEEELRRRGEERRAREEAARQAREEQRRKEEEERKRREEEEEERKKQEAALAKKQQDEQRKQALKEQIRRRHEATEKMRAAAVAAKQKREEEDAKKLQDKVPHGLLAPAAPAAAANHHQTPAPVVEAAASQQPAPVLPVVDTHSPSSSSSAAATHHNNNDGDRHQAQQPHHDETVLAMINAAAEKAKKDLQDKFNELLQEKEQLLKRVHAAEAESFVAHWQKTMHNTYSTIAKEMSGRKYLDTADFAHLSAIFTGYISLKNALDKEQPFAHELSALKGAIHDDLAHAVIDSIPPTAASGVPTLQRIVTSFEQNLVPAVRQTAFTANDEIYPMPIQHLRRIFAWYVLGSMRIKSPEQVRTQNTAYAASESVLAHTYEALNKGDLMAALRHIRHLPSGPVSSVGMQWAQGLHDRLVVEQATTIFDALIPPTK